MLTIQALNEYGSNTDEGLNRCLNNEDFYFQLIRMAVNDAGFDKLNTAIENGDKKEAFEAAHALKGVLGNLSLTPLYKPVSEMTELLRGGADADYSAYLEVIRLQRSRLQELCGD